MKLNIGMIIGLAGGVLGGSVGLAAAWAADPIMGAIMTVVVVGMFFLIYRVFLKPAMDYNRLLKGGLRGTGTIISISETGTRINNQPLCKIELNVEVAGQPSFTTTTKTVISYFQASQFQPGTQVPLMIDPKDHQKVMLMRQGDTNKVNNPLSNASPQQIDELKLKLAEMQKENDQIKINGIYSKAIVTKFTNMGVNVNGSNPLATLEIQVMPDNEPAFGAIVKGVIKQSSIPLYQPGEEIFVKYDPVDRTKVTIEHS
jgi:hypothetical protein